MAPGDDDDAPTRRCDARKLCHKARLLRHVLPALHGPDQVKGAILKWLLQRVGHLRSSLSEITADLSCLHAGEVSSAQSQAVQLGCSSQRDAATLAARQTLALWQTPVLEPADLLMLPRPS